MSLRFLSRINALIASANTATRHQDTTLADAVARLISGYGGGSISGITRETIIPQQTLNTNIQTTNGYGQWLTNYVRQPAEGNYYRVLLDGVEYIAEGKLYSSDNALCVGDINVIYSGSDTRLAFPFVIIKTAGGSFFISTRTNASHTLMVEEVTFDFS